MGLVFIYITLNYSELFGPQEQEPREEMISKELVYSNHALCRMDCREISKREVQLILEEGEFNEEKNDPYAKECPRFALEGETPDGQTIRVIFANCETETVVVTTIDLSEEHFCDCK